MKKYLLVAIDGTHYHSSKNIKCQCCQTKKDSKTGDTTYFHTAITPTIVHPKLKKVIALFQEFISNDDGEKKQDCEVNASKRWLDKFTLFASQYKLIILGDDLYSRVPMIKKIVEKGHSFILVCKETSHKILYEQVETFKLANSHKIFTTTRMHNGKKQILTYNFINELLLTGSNTNNEEVNWCELVITNLEGEQLHCFSFVTDLKITDKNVQEIVEESKKLHIKQDTLCAIISNASRDNQKTIITSLKNLKKDALKANRPAILVFGKVVRFNIYNHNV